MTAKQLTPKPATLPRRALTSAEFSQLSDVPPETEWLQGKIRRFLGLSLDYVKLLRHEVSVRH
jgi:hypothetical protein